MNPTLVAGSWNGLSILEKRPEKRGRGGDLMDSRQPLFTNHMAVFLYLTPSMAIPNLLPNTQKENTKRLSPSSGSKRYPYSYQLTHHRTTVLPCAPHRNFLELKFHIIQIFCEDSVALYHTDHHSCAQVSTSSCRRS